MCKSDAGRSELDGYNWVCPRCKGELRLLDDASYCSVCERRYESFLGIPDFRLDFQESENQVALAREFYTNWEELTYEDMVRARFRGLRQRALEAGKDPASFKMWDKDERAHLSSYLTRGCLHTTIVRNMVRREGASTYVGRLVDIGCGWGRDLLHLAGLADDVLGVDVSTFSLLMTKKLLDEQGVTNVRLVLAQGEYLPVPPQSVDAMNSSATIEHFPNPGAFLAEVSRCLKTPSWLVLYYPNRFSILPETHCGIWGLGWVSRARQNKIYARKCGGQWDVTLFSRRSFLRLLSSECEYKRVAITGIPRGLEDFLESSKFSKSLGSLAVGLIKRLISVARYIPGLERAISFICPVHFVAVIR